ncbi:hypothetical protein DFH09DRAFT_1151199 [Mycena vulgaris]|nr:hypothetical protein DFH09DRAFT_1151199 [Mycena vulgaris]
MAEAIALPLEIVELVVDNVFDVRDTLKACSLVSLQWAAASRLHLFHTTKLTNAHSVETLIELLKSPLSTISRSIHQLTVEVGPGFESDQAESCSLHLTRLSEICNTIDSLAFVPEEPSFKALSEIFLPPWSCFKLVRSMSFGPVLASPHSMFDFIASFPYLGMLEMDGLYWRPVAPFLVKHISPPPPPRLQALRLDCASGLVLGWLIPASPESSANLDVIPHYSLLDLRGITNGQIISIARCIHASGAVLRDLSLSLRLTNEDFVRLDVSRNYNLRSIRIEPDLSFEALPHLLCQLTSTSLEHIEVLMPGRPARLHAHDAHRWADLDRHLVGPQFSALSLTVRLHKAVDEDTIREYLPLCTARGLISCVLKPVLYSSSWFSGK